MADDLFADSTMTFGEHLEELRKHLIRAVQGVVVAFLVVMLMGDRVVKLIVDPVESKLEDYHTRKLERRTKKYSETQAMLSEGNRDRVDITFLFGPKQRQAFREAIGMGREQPTATDATAATTELVLPVDAAPLVARLTPLFAQINKPWSVKALSAQEGFVIWFKAVLGASLVVASPWVFYQLYSFVAVGLYGHERRFVHLTLPFSVCLFLLGVAVCFFLVFPAMLTFFIQTNEMIEIEPDIRLSEWVGFAVLLMVIFGVTFQLPLLMLMLDQVGIISYDMLRGHRRMAWFVSFILSAFISPGGDPNTMLLLALPICVLFEVGMLLMWYFQRHNPFAVAEPDSFDEPMRFD